MKKNAKIMVVDDEAIIRDSLRDWLTDAGHIVFTAEDGQKALETIQKEQPDIAIIDLVMPNMDGLETLKKARQIDPDIQVIIVTAYGSVNTAIQAIKEGAYDYIEKPFAPEQAELLIEKLIERQTLLEENVSLRQKLEDRYSFEQIFAKSARMQKVIEAVKVVAKSNATVLITGESGTGKELVARAIHAQSQRKDRAFIAVRCAALPETLLESELFGHERGAFSGANTERRGKFEAANRGTLFLDDIEGMSANIQVRLLWALEEKEFSRIGSSEPVRVDVRLIAATSTDLKKAVTEGQFREDLFYRLNVVSIELPPLRERREDVPLLAEHFLVKFSREHMKKVTNFSPEASDFLIRHNWPGNVRELENAIERAVILSADSRIEADDLAHESLLLARHPALSGKKLDDIEKNHIVQILVETGNNCSEAARILGISRMTLYNKIKAYEIKMNKADKS